MFWGLFWGAWFCLVGGGAPGGGWRGGGMGDGLRCSALAALDGGKVGGGLVVACACARVGERRSLGRWEMASGRGDAPKAAAGAGWGRGATLQLSALPPPPKQPPQPKAAPQTAPQTALPITTARDRAGRRSEANGRRGRGNPHPPKNPPTHPNTAPPPPKKQPDPGGSSAPNPRSNPLSNPPSNLPSKPPETARDWAGRHHEAHGRGGRVHPHPRAAPRPAVCDAGGGRLFHQRARHRGHGAHRAGWAGVLGGCLRTLLGGFDGLSLGEKPFSGGGFSISGRGTVAPGRIEQGGRGVGVFSGTFREVSEVRAASWFSRVAGRGVGRP